MDQSIGKRRGRSRVRLKKRMAHFACGVLVAVLLVFVLFPLLWVISTALKTKRHP